MTASDEAQVSRPRMSAEKRARLSAEAWRLADTENMSYRTIADRFNKRGDEVSFMTVGRLVKEARETAKFLDLISPAELRAGQLGRFPTYLEKIQAQITAGILDPAKGWALIATFERLLKEVGGTAMPTRLQVEGVDEKDPVPNMAVLQAFAAGLEEHDRRKQQIQATDGLGEFDE